MEISAAFQGRSRRGVRSIGFRQVDAHQMHARFFDHAGSFGPCDGASEITQLASIRIAEGKALTAVDFAADRESNGLSFRCAAAKVSTAAVVTVGGMQSGGCESRVIRAHQPGSEPIDIPETIPNPVQSLRHSPQCL
jgi:hypothetical protein